MAVDASLMALVRLYAADTDAASQLLTDAQYEALLGEHDGSARLAAADALEVIAASEVLVSKKIRTQDLATDGPAVSAELRALAQRHRDVAVASDSADLFDVVDTVQTGSCRPERTDEVWGL